jgi:hypothetical protein
MYQGGHWRFKCIKYTNTPSIWSPEIGIQAVHKGLKMPTSGWTCHESKYSSVFSHWPFWLGGTPGQKSYLPFSTRPKDQQPDLVMVFHEHSAEFGAVPESKSGQRFRLSIIGVATLPKKYQVENTVRHYRLSHVPVFCFVLIHHLLHEKSDFLLDNWCKMR